MKTKVAPILLSAYLIALFFANAVLLQRHTTVMCFDIVTAVILFAAMLYGGLSDGRA